MAIKITDFKPLQAEVIKLRKSNKELLEALQLELENRESTWDANDENSDTYKAIQKLKSLIKNQLNK